MRGLRLSPLLVGGGGGAAPFVPASLFTGSIAGGFWDISDITTLYQSGTRASPGTPVSADGDPIGLILDKSGNNNDLVQATAAFRPFYKPNSGLPYALFDGVDDLMSSAFTLGTTFDRVSAIRGLNFIAGNEAYFGGATTSGGQVFGSGTGAGTTWVMWNNTALGPAVSPTVNTDYVMTERWANPCQLALDNNGYTSTPAIAGANPGGMMVGSASGSTQANMRFYGGVMINRALTAGEVAQQRTYWAAKQGRVL